VPASSDLLSASKEYRARLEREKWTPGETSKAGFILPLTTTLKLLPILNTPCSKYAISTYLSTDRPRSLRRSSFPLLIRNRPQHAASSVVETASEPRAEASNAGSLRLRGHHAERTKDDKGVKWVEGTVDNEGLGRKKSKSTSSHPLLLFPLRSLSKLPSTRRHQVSSVLIEHSPFRRTSLLHLPQTSTLRRIVRRVFFRRRARRR
jgi:hypothetical protein